MQAQRSAFTGLWEVFSELRQVGVASCVTITKAVLLLSAVALVLRSTPKSARSSGFPTF